MANVASSRRAVRGSGVRRHDAECAARCRTDVGAHAAAGAVLFADLRAVPAPAQSLSADGAYLHAVVARLAKSGPAARRIEARGAHSHLRDRHGLQCAGRAGRGTWHVGAEAAGAVAGEERRGSGRRAVGWAEPNDDAVRAGLFAFAATVAGGDEFGLGDGAWRTHVLAQHLRSGRGWALLPRPPEHVAHANEQLTTCLRCAHGYSHVRISIGCASSHRLTVVTISRKPAVTRRVLHGTSGIIQPRERPRCARSVVRSAQYSPRRTRAI